MSDNLFDDDSASFFVRANDGRRRGLLPGFADIPAATLCHVLASRRTESE